MKMKLKKYLATLDDDTMICIGSKSNYMYFGTKNDINAIKERFDEYLSKIKKCLESSKKTLYYLMTTNVAIGMDWDKKKIDEAVKNRSEHVYNLVKSIHEYETYISKYKNPLDREVTDSYEKIVDDCKAIIITGSEMGDFWLKEEYDKKYGKKDVWIKEEYDKHFEKKAV